MNAKPKSSYAHYRCAYFTLFIHFRIGAVTVVSLVLGENTSDMWL